MTQPKLLSDLTRFGTDELLAEIREREVRETDIDDIIGMSSSNEIEVMTHAECVAKATEYMQKRADVVLPEFYTHNSELPDVIAFNRDRSTMIECKVSRSDFLRDKNKPFRMNPNQGMGDLRYYCCPKGLIRPEEMPVWWGLLYIYPDGRIRKQRDAHDKFKKNIEAEHYLLFYYARRAYYAGVHKTILEYRGYDG